MALIGSLPTEGWQRMKHGANTDQVPTAQNPYSAGVPSVATKKAMQNLRLAISFEGIEIANSCPASGAMVSIEPAHDTIR